MKREKRPALLLEADVNIAAFSDEYDLGEYIPVLMWIISF